MKKAMAFMKKHPAYQGSIHFLGGSIGCSLFFRNKLSFLGSFLLILAVVGHVYAWLH